MCTFPRPEASVIPTQTPRRGRVLPGGGCPLGTPSPSRSCMLRCGRRCARWRIEEAALGPLFRRWGVGRGGRAGLQSVATGYRRAGRGGRSCNLFQNVSVCFRSCRPPRKEQPRWAAWLQKAGLPLRRQALRARWERGEEAKSVRSEFGPCPALFGIVPVCSARSFEVKLMEEFLKYSEIASARPPRPTVGGHLRQIATHCGDLRYQPKPRRHSAADNGRVRSRDLRANRETSPGEIHGA